MSIKPLLLYVSLLLFPLKNDSMSSHYDLTVNNNYIKITTTLLIPETEPWDGKEEEKKVQEWKKNTLPLMNKILDTLQQKIPVIYKDLNLNLIKIDSSYISIWEETVNENDVKQFIISNKKYCQYKMKLYDLNIHNTTSPSKLNPVFGYSHIDHLYLSLAFNKNIPEKIIRDSLKVRILNILKKME